MLDPLFDLRDKVAVVTGSSRGIGKAIAFRLAQHGADVVISSRRQEACDAAVRELDELREPGWGKATAVAANVGRKADVDALMRSVESSWGRIDILVCNAGINVHAGPSADLSEEALRKVIESNVLGLYWLTRAVIPGMVARRSGRIISIASIAGLAGNGGSLSYGMTKAAGVNAMQTLAVELGGHGVRCNAIAPGMIRTDMSRAAMASPEALGSYVQRSPAGTVGEPDDIAGAVIFLASRAGSHVNGQTIVIDGGFTQA